MFKFSKSYVFIDEIECDAVPMDTCAVIVGSTYLWDRDAVLNRKLNEYRVVKDEELYVTHSYKGKYFFSLISIA
jgi:hypothetical protein